MRNIPLCIYVLSQQNNLDNIQNICQKFSEKHPYIQYQIFTRIIDATKKMSELEADIVFIDDALFDKFVHIIKTLKSDVGFTTKRFVVFSDKNTFSEKRSLELSLFGIRGSFNTLQKFPATLKSIAAQITNYQISKPKISLCLSGGGFDGYMYTLGVCIGLEACLKNFKMQDCDTFCGISSGSILASCYAGGINSLELVQQAYNKHHILEPISLCTFFDFALSDFLKHTCQRQMPVGLFKGEKIKKFFSRQITNFGHEDSLDVLKKNIYIFATDQDTGKIVVLGKDPWKKNIKISQAIRASIAIPPFYLPENINGHWFTDGQLATSTDFDLPIHENGSLIIMVDPIVAFSSTQAGEVQKRGGYFTLLQAVKNLLHSRSDITLQHARDKHPDVDFIKFQPSHKIMELMSGNPMRIPIRKELIEASARATCEQILAQYDSFQHKFLKHGLTLKPRSAIITNNLLAVLLT